MKDRRINRWLALLSAGWVIVLAMVLLGAWQAQNFQAGILGATQAWTGLNTFTGSQPQLSAGLNGGNAGQLSLQGSTSGAATVTAPAVAGTATNPIAITNTLQLPSGTVYQINADTGLSRGSANVWDVGSGAAASTAGFIKSAQTLQVTGSNFTTASVTLVAVTGLTFTAPASAATNWSFRCDLVYSQATAAAANLWGIITTQTAPTNLQVEAEILTSNVAVQVDNNALITTAASTTVATATPSGFGAIAANATMFNAHIYGTLEAPSNASPTQVAIAVATGNASDSITVYRGSSCWWY